MNTISTVASATPRTGKTLNVVVLGGTGVGKSAVISQLLHHTFPKKADCTIELEREKITFSKKGKAITLNVIDTPGGYCFGARRRIAIKSGNAFVLVFSLEDEDSFVSAALIRDDILSIKSKDVPIILVGNKADVGQHVTRNYAAELFAKREWNAKYVETSAKDNKNVEIIFHKLLKVYRKRNSLFCRLMGRRFLKSSKTSKFFNRKNFRGPL